MTAQVDGIAMRMRHWLILIGLVMGVGWLQVAQRNALVMKGYAVGERLHRLQEQETDISRLDADVASLTSPAALARAANERRLTLVAWSTVDSAQPPDAQGARSDGAVIRIASDARD